MKIRADFVTNSSSSSYLVITVTKKDGNNVVFEDENRAFNGLGGFRCTSIRDLYDALTEAFEDDLEDDPEDDFEGTEDFLDKILEIGDLNDIESIKIESSLSAWDGDFEDPEDWEGCYDKVIFDEDMNMVTGIDSSVYVIKNGTAVLASDLQKNEPEDWRDLFWERILERGREYADSGRVQITHNENGVIYASIQGSEEYKVELTLSSAEKVQSAFCSCPYAMDGRNCKHMAAVLFKLGI